MEFDLDRFVKAQERYYPIALREIQAGRKESHWMWFVFSQLKGLGKSSSANYFGIQKSDLIEEPMTAEKEKDNDIMADIIVRMRTDDEFFSCVKSLYMYDSAKIRGMAEMLNAFEK